VTTPDPFARELDANPSSFVTGYRQFLYRLSDNSISEQKHVKNKLYKAFKSKRRNSIITGSNCVVAYLGGANIHDLIF
jgi:hypothetical protein